MALDFAALSKNVTATLFNLTGPSVKKTVLFTPRPSSGTYNPVTDSYPAVTTYSVSGIFYQSKEQKLSVDVSKVGMFLIQASDLAATGYAGGAPTIGDTLKDGSVIWNIELVDSDPGNSVYICRIRK